MAILPNLLCAVVTACHTYYVSAAAVDTSPPPMTLQPSSRDIPVTYRHSLLHVVYTGYTGSTRGLHVVYTWLTRG